MELAEPRSQDDRDADEPENELHQTPPSQPLAKEGRREQRRPDRHRELDGEHGGERERADGVHPAVLAQEMHERARRMQREALRDDDRAAVGGDQHGDDGKRHAGAQREDLQRAHVALQLAHRDRHRGEREHCAQHP